MKIFKNNIYHDKRVEKLSHKLDIPEHVIEESLDLMYGYVKSKIEAVEVVEDVLMTEEEFNEKFPVVHIPSLGYFVPSFKKYSHQIKNKYKKNDENIAKDQK